MAIEEVPKRKPANRVRTVGTQNRVGKDPNLWTNENLMPKKNNGRSFKSLRLALVIK